MGVADSTRDKKMDSPGKQMPGSSIDRQTARQLAEMEKQLKRERGRRRRKRRSGMREGTLDGDGETGEGSSESWATGDRQERRQATVS